MASTFECIGLTTPDDRTLEDLLSAVLPDAVIVATSSAGELWRWQDPSGARLALTVEGGLLTAVQPALDAAPSLRLGNVFPLNPQTAAVDVVDETGQTFLRMALELEQQVLLRSGDEVAGPASVAALGVEVRTHASVEEFDRSPSATLGEGSSLKVSAESLIPLGLFGDAAAARPAARLSGTVLSAGVRVNGVTGASFVVARVRTAGIEIDVCLPAATAPDPGAVLSGSVILTGSMRSLEVSAAASAPS